MNDWGKQGIRVQWSGDTLNSYYIATKDLLRATGKTIDKAIENLKKLPCPRCDVRAMLWNGGDAPNKKAKLSVEPQYDNSFGAYWEPGYCGCEDCHFIVGRGATEAEAIADYWERWEDKYGS